MSGLIPRAVCYRCDKPQALCLCTRIPRIENETTVLVLQHPRERQHPIGTARFARLGLRRARVEVAWNAGQREETAPAWVPPGTALLYPAPGARDLEQLRSEERPRQLLVLDGTWRTAASLYREKTWLQRLPHVRLSPPAPSRYRLRMEPLPDYVSTIEAIVHALRVLEPETAGLDALLGAFDAMIDEQLAFVLRRAGPRRERARRPEHERRLPRAITHDFARIVVVQTESVPAPRPAGTAVPARKTERELVQVSVQALNGGARAQWHVLPADRRPPRDPMLEYMELAAGDFDGALDLPSFRAAWQRFLDLAGPAPIVAAWNHGSLELLARAGASQPERLVLKSAYRGRCGAEQASLEDVVAAAALEPVPNALRGRAARRLSCAVAVAEHLRALASAR